MSKLEFCYFMNYEDGEMARFKTMAWFNTTESEEIPVNIYIDDAGDLEYEPEGHVEMDIYGIVKELKVYPSEEEYMKQEKPIMAPISMIPIGTFPESWPDPPEDEDFDESPHIYFTGRVVESEWYPDAGEDWTDCKLLVETLGIELNLLLRYGKPISEGCIVQGVAWLFGNLGMEGLENNDGQRTELSPLKIQND